MTRNPTPSEKPEGEEDQQRDLLETAIGLPGSGYMRYGAAMYFYKHGQLSHELLEIYRRCCKLDHTDPLTIARKEGVS